MKNYVKPSIEVSKFSVEDIITASGVMTGSFTEGSAADSVYDKYLMGNDGVVGGGDDRTAAANVVEFQW